MIDRTQPTEREFPEADAALSLLDDALKAVAAAGAEGPAVIRIQRELPAIVRQRVEAPAPAIDPLLASQLLTVCRHVSGYRLARDQLEALNTMRRWCVEQMQAGGRA